MQINTSAKDNILSMLKDAAEASYVRVTHHKNRQQNRLHLGDENSGAALLASFSGNSDGFVQEQRIVVAGYQINISLVNKQCVQIEILQTSQISSNELIEERRTISPIEHHSSSLKFEFVSSKSLSNAFLKWAEDSNDDSLESRILPRLLLAAQEIFELVEQYTELTSDKLTKLKSRNALQHVIDEQIQQSNMALCMVHCIDFQHVNRKFGQAKGDQVLQEITHVLEQHTRTNDVTGRFGGALFGIALYAQTIEDGRKLAAKLHSALHETHYLQNAIRLNFNIGVAFISQQENSLDDTTASSILISRSEQALKAAQKSAKPSVVQWEADKFRLDEQDFNYLGGIFTPDNVTNYRNMLLLWDISSIVADEHSFPRLLKSVIERLALTFEFGYCGVISEPPTEQSDTATEEAHCFELVDGTSLQALAWQRTPYSQFISQQAGKALESSKHVEYKKDGLCSLVVPLGESSTDCFYILGNVNKLNLSYDSVMLFAGFARQLGKALKRSQLEDQLNRSLERQNAELEQELSQLKAGLKSSALVYRSQVMQKVVEQTQRAAQTDTTVLITGESGTGKEKLINAIHNLSPRNNKPLVIVDCGSIPENLIESELFGHTKGAFTGAQTASSGKIQAADGGIIVLDEIGELPLSMQPKLLRFVQEKYFTPVGSTKASIVDVKIVAVTNRDLALDVSQGKFRKDLFYRLNVVTLHNPPLRDRMEDIELLCQHFLSKFAKQFDVDKKLLSQQTIDKMKAYSWPGNIRELENKLMQATLLTSNREIQFSDLDLNDNSLQDLDNTQVPSVPVSSNLQTSEPTLKGTANNSSAQEPEKPTQSEHADNIQVKIESVEQWQQHFYAAVSGLLTNFDLGQLMQTPLGSIIEYKLLDLAYQACGTHSKTAVLLQLPVSTARRRLKKSAPDFTNLHNNTHWQAVEDLLAHIVEYPSLLALPVEEVKNQTARVILKQYRSNMALAAQLMDVSEPTMYKYRKALIA